MTNQQAKIYLKIIQKMNNPNTRNPTDEELNTLQEHLTPEQFEQVLKDMEERFWIRIWNIIETPVNDPHWYSLD